MATRRRPQHESCSWKRRGTFTHTLEWHIEVGCMCKQCVTATIQSFIQMSHTHVEVYFFNFLCSIKTVFSQLWGDRTMTFAFILMFVRIYVCVNLPWPPVGFLSLVVDRYRRPGLYMCVRARKRDGDRLFSCIVCACLYLYMLTFHSAGISDMPAGSSAPCSSTTYPSISPVLHCPLWGTHEKSLPGIWALPVMVTSTVNRCVGFIGIMMVIIQQGSRRIMSLMTESCLVCQH